MKSGVRALGIAESYRGRREHERRGQYRRGRNQCQCTRDVASDDDAGNGDGSGSDDGSSGADDSVDAAHRNRSTLAGAVVRADRVVDGLTYGQCAVGGTDATDAIVSLLTDLERPDVRYVLLGAIAPAWYNILDLSRIHEAAERPVFAVTFEASPGLESDLREAFSGEALQHRLAIYRRLPPRTAVTVNDETVYARWFGCEREEAVSVIRSFTPVGGRPEPIRVARLAARAGDAYRPASQDDHDDEDVEDIYDE
ncbi:UPF0215 family protein [Natrialba magadii ATCC 43099]|uniref:UPF0215 protein Nmag_1444 n=1 Tax=Natrialba magadii (strain ATCC 43099 / DSM 3394 / CCM 3739 / CIP 104546 / IAM 13178 / JCM 8861 / NBRC 102185 / NCIMB 2190 / MS3) TaxID=547559 RepID=D3STK6_NATMM|nr:DUF99 family protein [Natrialba magadii]ADD05023.1 UPF0215 family protein [Natrialba magadii ATCC 43099]ELY23397.1 hypothetical protein C500_19744 [Natrialba magadii ATCC 43099]